MAYQNPLFDVYQNTLGRNPDQAGYDFWNQQMQNGMSLTDIRNQLSASQEATTGNSYTGDTISWNGGGSGDQSAFDPAVVTDAVTNATQGMTQDLSGINTAVAGVGDQVTGVSNQVTGVGNAVDAGFASMDQQFGQVQQNQNTINDNMESGFVATNENLNSGLQGVVDNANTNTQNVVDNTNAGFATAAEQLTAAQTAILGGQSNLDQLLQDTGSRLDTYYGGLADGQAQLQSSADNMQTDFTDYTTQYGRDVSLAQQSRDDIQNGMMSQTELIRDDMGAGMNAVQQGQSNLMKAVGGSGPAASGFAMAPASGGTAAPQQPQQQPNPVQQRIQQMGQRVTQLRPLIQQAVANPQINTALRLNADQMGRAFADDGTLIPRSQEENGTIVARSVDEKGNLFLRRYDPSGQVMGDHTLNLDQTAQQLLQIAAPSAGGFAGGSPYARSF